MVVGRELTKRFEQVHRCTAASLTPWLAEDANRLRGEFVLAFAAPASRPLDEVDADTRADEAAQTAGIDDWLRALCAAMPPRQAARVAAQATGLRANDLYERSMRLRS